ncbi:hypothetical protein EI94DRAFT_1733780 [Lactarius quietus]|nr:hypothetical protein EI94DRAFT_1733780 [Lactarius quietus]
MTRASSSPGLHCRTTHVFPPSMLRRDNVSIVGELRPTFKFLSDSGSTTMEDENRITLMSRPENEGTHTLPSYLAIKYANVVLRRILRDHDLYARGILFGNMVLVLGNACTVHNDTHYLHACGRHRVQDEGLILRDVQRDRWARPAKWYGARRDERQESALVYGVQVHQDE